MKKYLILLTVVWADIVGSQEPKWEISAAAHLSGPLTSESRHARSRYLADQTDFGGGLRIEAGRRWRQDWIWMLALEQTNISINQREAAGRIRDRHAAGYLDQKNYHLNNFILISALSGVVIEKGQGRFKFRWMVSAGAVYVSCPTGYVVLKEPNTNNRIRLTLHDDGSNWSPMAKTGIQISSEASPRDRVSFFMQTDMQMMKIKNHMIIRSTNIVGDVQETVEKFDDRYLNLAFSAGMRFRI